MGLLSKLGQKIGDAMEKSASQNMTGKTKELYEEEKLKNQENEQHKVVHESIEVKYEKDDLKNLDQFIGNSPFVDSEKIWIAGFSNHRTNQNATAANLFTGKKNLRFFMVNKDLFYFAHFVDQQLASFKVMQKSDIRKSDIKSKLIGASTVYIEHNDGTKFTIDVTENKAKLEVIKNILK
jgi:hypothetical protein